MTDDEIRSLIREAIARHLGREPGVAPCPPALPPVPPPWKAHVSHARFILPSGGDTDGPCFVEPEVRCTHCGYCQSYGH